MSKEQIIRAWKDEKYRASLTTAELAELPLNPAGIVELSAAELGAAVGGEDGGTQRFLTYGCCRGGIVSALFGCVAGIAEE